MHARSAGPAGGQEEVALGKLPFHCQITPFSRKAGSIIAKVAYRACCNLYDNRIGREWCYSSKGSLLWSAMTTADGTTEAPDRTVRQDLWNAAEAAERRKDARLGRELRLGLPCVLREDGTPDEEHTVAIGKKIGLAMAAWASDRYGVAVDQAMHKPDHRGDKRNYHIHAVWSSRKYINGKFTDKVRILDDKKTGPQEVKLIRETYCNIVNNILKQHKINAYIDNRSLKDQGSQKLPTIHMGHAATAMERRGIKTYKGNINRTIKDYNDSLQFNINNNIAIIDKDIDLTIKNSVVKHDNSLDNILQQIVKTSLHQEEMPCIPVQKSRVNITTILSKIDGISKEIEDIIPENINENNYSNTIKYRDFYNNIYNELSNNINARLDKLLTKIRSKIKIIDKKIDNLKRIKDNISLNNKKHWIRSIFIEEVFDKQNELELLFKFRDQHNTLLYKINDKYINSKEYCNDIISNYNNKLTLINNYTNSSERNYNMSLKQHRQIQHEHKNYQGR